MKRAFRLLHRVLKRGVFLLFGRTRALRPFYETANTQTPITFPLWFAQKVVGFNKGAYWPTHFTSRVVGWQNVYAGIETAPGYSPGCYIQGLGKIFIGDYTQIACNVGIISANHELHDNRHHTEKSVTIGKYCWIGMNSVILPGVELGDYVIVGAGAVVTKSFPEGYCVVGGNPARLIKQLDAAECVHHISEHEYNGYIPKSEFEEFRKRHLHI